MQVTIWPRPQARAPGCRGARPAGLVVGAGLILTAAVCGPGPPNTHAGEDMPERSIQEVQEAHTDEWMRVPGVVGTGIGLCEGEPCIVVFATEMTDEIEAEIPDEVEGYPVRVEVTGPFRPHDPGST